jgi:chromosome segregation ATPase
MGLLVVRFAPKDQGGSGRAPRASRTLVVASRARAEGAAPSWTDGTEGWAMADGVEGSGARLVDVSVPAQRQRMALLLNGVLGLAFLGATAVGLGLAYSSKLSSGGAASIQDDALTVAMVAIVAVVWGGLLTGSVRWERGLAQPRTLAVPIRALVDRGGRPQLAASEAEAVCDQLADEADLEPPWWMATGAGLLISIGLAGTFLGLSLGLLQTVPLLVGAQASAGSDAADVTAALMPLLEGAKLAFVKSLAGVVLGTLWTLRMAELRHFAAGARAHLRARLLDTFPPVTPEALLSELLASRDEDRRVQADALSAAAVQVTTALTDAIKAQADAAEAGAQQRSEVLAQARGEAQTGLLAALAPLPALNTAAAQMAEDLRQLRGGDEASVHALVGKLDALKTTVDAAAESLPVRIGTATGSSVSTGMKASFTDIANALTSLSSQGGEAVSDVLKESVGQQTSALSEALAALTTSLSGLPQGVAASGTAAQQVLDRAAADGAQRLVDAASAFDDRSKGNIERSEQLLGAVQELVERLRADGSKLQASFAEVAAPLAMLPAQLDAASAGVTSAATAAERGAMALHEGIGAASTQLTSAGDATKQALEAGAREAAAALKQAADQVGAGLKTDAGAAAQHLVSGAGVIEGRLKHTGEELRSSVGGELAGVAALLRDQGDAQRALLDALKEERAASAQSMATTRSALVTLQESGDGLRDAVARLDQQVRTLTNEVSGAGAALRTDAEGAAQALKGAGAELAGRLTEVAEATGKARDAVDAAGAVADSLMGGSAALRDAFGAVAAPLVMLPAQLDAASAGVTSAATAAERGAKALHEGTGAASSQLTSAGDATKQALEAGAREAAAVLKQAADQVGAGLRTDAGAAAQHLVSGAGVIEGRLKNTGEDLRASVGAELAGVAALLGDQAGAQRALLAALKEERAASAQTMATSRAALVTLQESGDSLRDAVARLDQQVRTLTNEVSGAGAALRTDAEGAAQALKGAGAELAGRLTEVAEATGMARDAVDAAGAVADSLMGGSAALRDAFGAVTEPLADLPRQLATTKEGLEAARAGLGQVGAQLSEASQTFGEGATQAARALAEGGEGLAAGLAAARRELGEGFTTELVAIQGALGAQLTAQEGMLAGTKEQHELMARSADMARQRLESLNDKSTALVEGIETLRQTCADTVAALQAAAGDQRSGADQAVQGLLTAVAKFSESLDKSQGAVQDASLRAVASTEQVTAEAARRVADALVQGADRFEQSMGRVEQVGQRLDAHGQALEKNLSAAQGAAAALTGHGEALVRSAGALKAELAEVVSPLSDARSSLMTVPGAVNAAVTTLRTEHTALSGLSTSLKDQAELVRAQERELANRTAELRRVTDALGGQIAAHVDRLTKAQEKVAVAWAEAVAAGDERHEERVKAVASYADRVEQALGLGSSVRGLTEALRDVADSLADMRKLPAEVASLHASITKLEAALDGGAG